MKLSRNYVLVLVTAPNLRVARRLTRQALKQRLVACANLVPAIESHYWWKDKLETGKEVLILFKTLRSSLRQLEIFILSEHPYETPEFLVVALDQGSQKYLEWIGREVSG